MSETLAQKFARMVRLANPKTSPLDHYDREALAAVIEAGARVGSVAELVPELLAALKDAVGVVADVSSVPPSATSCAWFAKAQTAIEKAQAVIAKAEGGSQDA